jgi:hypothetical protein
MHRINLLEKLSAVSPAIRLPNSLGSMKFERADDNGRGKVYAWAIFSSPWSTIHPSGCGLPKISVSGSWLFS